MASGKRRCEEERDSGDAVYEKRHQDVMTFDDYFSGGGTSARNPMLCDWMTAYQVVNFFEFIISLGIQCQLARVPFGPMNSQRVIH